MNMNTIESILHLYRLGADGAFPAWGRVPMETRRMVAAPVRSWWRREDFSAELRLAWSEAALEVATREIGNFLKDHDMTVYLVLYRKP